MQPALTCSSEKVNYLLATDISQLSPRIHVLSPYISYFQPGDSMSGSSLSVLVTVSTRLSKLPTEQLHEKILYALMTSLDWDSYRMHISETHERRLSLSWCSNLQYALVFMRLPLSFLDKEKCL